MKILKHLLPFILFYITAPATAQSLQKDFEQLKRLTGTWQVDNGREFEHWDISDTHTLTGMGYVLRQNDTIINERLLLTLSGDSLTYIATVTRQNKGLPVSFHYTGQKDGGYVFENQQHDFPRKIVYRFDNNDQLFITLSGKSRQQDKVVQFTMSKIKN